MVQASGDHTPLQHVGPQMTIPVYDQEQSGLPFHE